ncbi:hypothetical protein AAG906_003667 [Vitis piasezkii]
MLINEDMMKRVPSWLSQFKPTPLKRRQEVKDDEVGIEVANVKATLVRLIPINKTLMLEVFLPSPLSKGKHLEERVDLHLSASLWGCSKVFNIGLKGNLSLGLDLRWSFKLKRFINYSFALGKGRSGKSN